MDHKQERLRPTQYLIGALSFIPIIGVLFGITAVIWGYITFKTVGRKLITIGISGIAASFFLMVLPISFLAAAGYCDSRLPLGHGEYRGSEENMAIGEISVLLQLIEFYKIANGRYPDNLDSLLKAQSKRSNIFIFDGSYGNGMERYFYYQVVDSDHYYLLGLGKDGLPFTTDDILPDISLGPNSRVGYIVKTASERGT